MGAASVVERESERAGPEIDPNGRQTRGHVGHRFVSSAPSGTIWDATWYALGFGHDAVDCSDMSRGADFVCFASRFTRLFDQERISHVPTKTHPNLRANRLFRRNHCGINIDCDTDVSDVNE